LSGNIQRFLKIICTYTTSVQGTKCCVLNALYAGLELEWADIQPTL
jgi:hypothetical protein